MLKSSSLSIRRPPALRHRNFRVFYSGQFLSLIGTWMQIAAQNWLVYQLTGSAEKLGTVSAIQLVPGLLLTAWGGVIADRYSKRAILLVTQSVSMFLAVALYFLVHWGTVRYEHILWLALLLGFVNAVDMPTRGAFVVELVGKEDLHSGIALNSSIFNASRIMGPAVAGTIVAHWGMATCFLLNAISFVAPLVCLMMLDLPPTTSREKLPTAWSQLHEGLAFIRSHAAVRDLLQLMAISSVLGWGTMVVLPIFAGDILHAGAQGYGYLMAAGGVGALIAALLLSMVHQDASAIDELYRRRVVGGILVYSIATIAFAWSRNLPLSIALQVVGGWASITYFSTSNTWLQALITDEYRGRVMGVYHTMFQTFMPLGTYLTGWVATWIGAPMALTVFMSLTVIVGVVSGMRRVGAIRAVTLEAAHSQPD